MLVYLNFLLFRRTRFSGMDPKKRMYELVESASSRPREPRIPPSITSDKLLQLLNDMHQMGSSYAGKGQDDERAFMSFLRYISIVVEELPKHPCYFSLSTVEKHVLDIRTLNAMVMAEQLKRRIRQRYEREKELADSGQSISEPLGDPMASTSRATSHQPVQPLESDLLVPESEFRPYVRCQSVSVQPIVFQRVIIPNNIPELFLAQQMDSSSGVRFALLYGRLIKQSVIVSQLLPCHLESITTKNLRRFIIDVDSAEEFPIVGCICSSLSKTCQSGFFRASQISEMVCVVCPPVPNRTIILHLVNMSPSGGSPAQTASQSLGPPCVHQHITDSIHAAVVRKENLVQQNGSAEIGFNKNSGYLRLAMAGQAKESPGPAAEESNNQGQAAGTTNS